MEDWIDIEEDKPIIDDFYLVYLLNGHICIGHWMSEDFWSTGYYVNRLEVSHWMELPAAPTNRRFRFGYDGH